LRFTALCTTSTPGNAAQAYFSLKKEAAPGVDGETWRHYGEQLEANLQDLSERLKRGAYRAKPCVECISLRRRAAKTARSNGAGRQNRPASGGRGAERYLRTDFLIFVRVPARAKPDQALDALYTGLLREK